MHYSFGQFLSLIGSLGLFLFGMKLMSESLQKVAGDRMRNILAAMTSNRFKSILTGMLITMVIQSLSLIHISRAHETVLDLVCRLLLEKKKTL